MSPGCNHADIHKKMPDCVTIVCKVGFNTYLEGEAGLPGLAFGFG